MTDWRNPPLEPLFVNRYCILYVFSYETHLYISIHNPRKKKFICKKTCSVQCTPLSSEICVNIPKHGCQKLTEWMVRTEGGGRGSSGWNMVLFWIFLILSKEYKRRMEMGSPVKLIHSSFFLQASWHICISKYVYNYCCMYEKCTQITYFRAVLGKFLWREKYRLSFLQSW